MSHLFSSHCLSKSFGKQCLFENIDLFIDQGDRIGLIGPNGSGKSTLLKIICGLEEPDTGKVMKKKHLATGYIAQDDEFEEESTLMENMLKVFHGDEHIDESEQHVLAQTALSLGEFVDPGSAVSSLSGGWKKRLSICRALVRRSDILAMDEPTNHLDVESILWLERLLNSSGDTVPSTFLIVSHDRRFLENCTNRIVELSPGYPQGSFQVSGSYSKFIVEREKFFSSQEELELRLSNKVRRETEWLRRGPKARTTKARFRINEAHRLQEELLTVRTRNRTGVSARIDFDSSGRKTKKLLVGKKITKQVSGTTLFSDLDIVLSPGSRLGILGKNGCGKSTLMHILAAAANPENVNIDGGTIQTADSVQIVSFDQKRGLIDTTQTLRRALAPEGDSIIYRGRSIHVVSWAKRFLFRVDQLETPVAQLSGGEQARIHLAALMRQPADILLLDEPTNDLDIPTLDVLQESLVSFPGALVLVTHDRYLLDQVCHQILGFDGNGGVHYYGDYEQYLLAVDNRKNGQKKVAKTELKKSGGERSRKKPSRLSYLEQREYDSMEEKITEAESEELDLKQFMESPEAESDPDLLHEYWLKLEKVQSQIQALYSRWDELEQKRAQ